MNLALLGRYHINYYTVHFCERMYKIHYCTYRINLTHNYIITAKAWIDSALMSLLL